MRPLLLVIAVVCLSLPALLIRGARAPIEAIGFWRLFLACAVLAPWAWPRRKTMTAPVARSIAVAGALFFLHLWTFTWAVSHTSVAHLMLAFSTHPVWTGLGAWLFFKEPLGRRELGAFALAAAGVVVLFGGSIGAGGAGLAGDLSALLSAMFFSAWVLAGRRVRRGLDTVSFLFAAYAAAAFLFFAAGTAKGGAWSGWPASTWAALAALAFAVSLGGHGLFTYLLNTYGVLALSCAKLVEPVLAALGAFWLFGEPLSPRLGAAFALIATGVVVLLRSPRARPGPREDLAEG
ncbi:MAG: DMT family transporter [Elusimicrobia bacterium]|nr:DMT family transporter [Elusimicrobiota bacterium]